MKLEDLYTNILDLSYDELTEFIDDYRASRYEILHRTPIPKERKAKATDLTEEEQVYLKLGLKKKDIIALRSMDIIEDKDEELEEDEEDNEDVEVD